MKHKELKFEEISDNHTQATVHFPCNFSLQIIYDRLQDDHTCSLYNREGSKIDYEEGLDEEGVEGFIHESELLVDLYKESELDGALAYD